MKYLAQKPVTIRDRAKRSFALVLDSAFISSSKLSRNKQFVLNLPDFDALVEKLEESFGGRAAGVAEQLSGRLDAITADIKEASARLETRYAEWLEHARKHPLSGGSIHQFAADMESLDRALNVLHIRRMEIFHALELLTLP